MTRTRSMTLCALFAALTAVLSQISIPLPGLVPINLATLSVFLCGALLGARRAAVSLFVYLSLGAIGLPVFAGFRSGLGALAGPTGGYLIGYVAAAVLTGLLLTLRPTKRMLPFSMLAGCAVCYVLGTFWYAFSVSAAPMAALTACVLPFLPGDAAKISVACIVASRIGILQYAGKTQPSD